jgi:DNA invertase Pin-like site-specific DNA recombinase
MSNNVLAYVREPDGDEQRAIIEGYCTTHGLLLSDVFTDAADASNIPWVQRAAGGRLAARLTPGSHVVIAGLHVVYTALADLLAVLRDWRERRITLHVVAMEDFFTSSEFSLRVEGPVSDLVVRALTNLQAFRHARRSEAVREGMLRRKRTGKRYCRHAGYGHTWKGRKGRQGRKPDPYEQAVMAKIVDWVAAGYSYYAVAAHLLREGIETADGKEWSPSRVRRAYLAALQQRVSPPREAPSS